MRRLPRTATSGSRVHTDHQIGESRGAPPIASLPTGLQRRAALHRALTRCAFLAGFTLFAPAAPSFAQPPIRVDAEMATSRVRSDAPMTLRFHVTSNSTEILVGRLELTFHFQRQVVGRYRSGELALSSDQYSFDAVLPPIAAPDEFSLLFADARFVGDRLSLDLGQYSFVVPVSWKRDLLIGASHAWGNAPPPGDIDFADALRFEQLRSDRSLAGELSTTAARLAPRDFPRSSAALCAYDLLLLAGDGFTDMSDRQLEAIAEWVEAGGSVFVAPDGTLDLGHVTFLNRLAASGPGNMTFSLDERGRLQMPIREQDTRIAMLQPGLGRAVIALEQIPSNDVPHARYWRETLAFLWKLRADQMAEVRKNGTWNLGLPEAKLRGDRFDPSLTPSNARQIPGILPYGAYGELRPIGTRSQSSETLLPELLFPDRIRGISFTAIVAILLLFLLIIAPGDYFLLGYFKCRKYTWLFFPAVSIAFTLLTMQLARRALGTADHRNGIVFVDVIEGNRAARTSRFELRFAAAPQTIDSEYRNTLHTSIDPRRFGASQSNFVQYSTPNALLQTPFDPPVYEGRIPSVYRVVERMPQWTTRMSRQTTIAGSKPLPPFDWDAIGPEVFRTKELLDTVLSSRVSKAFSDAVILVWNGGGIVYVNNIGEGTFSNSDFHDGIPGPDDLTVKYETQDVLNRQRARLQVIADTSIGTPTGLFSLVSQIAPTGGGHFDDLIMVDSSDRSQWLLAVLTKQNNDYVVYRRLYREPR